LHLAFGKNFSLAKNFSRRSVARFSIFSPAKKLAVARRYPCQVLNGWAVCRFHGARGAAPGGKRNRNDARIKATIELWRLFAASCSAPRSDFSTLGDLVVLSMIALVLASATVAFPHPAAANDLDHRQVREAQFRAYAPGKVPLTANCKQATQKSEPFAPKPVL
jgi:hypothetical protein